MFIQLTGRFFQSFYREIIDKVLSVNVTAKISPLNEEIFNGTTWEMVIMLWLTVKWKVVLSSLTTVRNKPSLSKYGFLCFFLQIPSHLRAKEKCTVIPRSQIGCDFLVSRRMGVVKRYLSGRF